MLNTYQQQIKEVREDPKDQSFATIGAVYSDGISLIFDGETDATLKHYKCNLGIRFSAGQRVRIIKDSGTYIVEYPVGDPIALSAADVATMLKNSETSYANIELRMRYTNSLEYRMQGSSAWIALKNNE